MFLLGLDKFELFLLGLVKDNCWLWFWLSVKVLVCWIAELLLFDLEFTGKFEFTGFNGFRLLIFN